MRAFFVLLVWLGAGVAAGDSLKPDARAKASIDAQILQQLDPDGVIVANGGVATAEKLAGDLADPKAHPDSPALFGAQALGDHKKETVVVHDGTVAWR